MSKRYRTYFGIVLILLIGVINTPFAWLHQCEYAHKHAITKVKHSSDSQLDEEIPDCPICELNFPLYVSDNAQTKLVKTAFQPWVSHLFDSAYLAEFQHFYPLRAPPVC